MHKKTVCKVLNNFQHGKDLVAYVFKLVTSEKDVTAGKKYKIS